MTWVKENWFKVGVLVGLSIVSYSFYQNLVIAPKREASIIKSCTAEVRLAPHNVGILNQEEFDNCLLKNGIIK